MKYNKTCSNTIKSSNTIKIWCNYSWRVWSNRVGERICLFDMLNHYIVCPVLIVAQCVLHMIAWLSLVWVNVRCRLANTSTVRHRWSSVVVLVDTEDDNDDDSDRVPDRERPMWRYRLSTWRPMCHRPPRPASPMRLSIQLRRCQV